MPEPEIALPVLERIGPLARRRHSMEWPWHEGEDVPDHLKVLQSWGWLFIPDGRCIVLIDTVHMLPVLPGGSVEDEDHGDPSATLKREAAEEAQLALGPAHYLGYLHDETSGAYDGLGPRARVRMAASVTRIGGSAIDPATGATMIRLLAAPHRIVELFGWGEQGHRQADAAIRAARDLWGYPQASSPTVSEIPLEGGSL
ncbi:hypothetical protein OG814_31985 [Streptomyces zaomyceticus]|uniref:NUDIX hydrolase n=1 Tax=Streptomyces zaomyceticus TaxID=68286 RepID=A0ABZ1LMV1_9ACTN